MTKADDKSRIVDWLEAYPEWSGLEPAHPRVAKAACAYLKECDLKAAIPVMLGEGPYTAHQVNQLRNSREFWTEVVAQIRQRRLGALARVAAGGADRASMAAANAAAEIEAVVGKWLNTLLSAHAKRKGTAPTAGPEVVEW